MTTEIENKNYRDIPLHPSYGTTTLPHHKWRRESNGDIDVFVLDAGHCNGQVAFAAENLFAIIANRIVMMNPVLLRDSFVLLVRIL